MEDREETERYLECETLTEFVAKLKFYQIAHTISSLHGENICHREMKLENILSNPAHFKLK